MNNERAFELLSAAADYKLSDAEQAELTEILRNSSEARRLQSELSQLDNILAGVPDIDPPDDLHEKIMQQVSLPKPKVSRSVSGWLKPIQFGSVLRYGFSVAFGVMLAVAVYESQPNFARSMDITEIVGTMAPDLGTTNRKILDSFSLTTTGVSSIARLEQRDDALVLDIRIEATQPVDIKIDFAGAALEFEALAQTLSNLDSFEFSDQVLKVKGRGQRRFAVMMRSRNDAPFGKDTKIHLEYSSDGALLQQGTLISVR